MDDALSCLLPQPFGVSETQTQRKPTIAIVFDRASPIGHLEVDRPNTEAVSLCILNEHSRHVEAHRLIVENGTGERCEVFHLEISRSIGNQSKARCMTRWETVESKRADVFDDRV